MNTHNKTFSVGIVFLTALALLALAAGFTYAQGQGPESPAQPQSEAGVATIAPGAIPIQGRLTNASGAPLNGTYTVTFRLYDDASAVTALCSDIRPVAVQNGLFSDYMDHCYDDINGQKLWLGVQVAGDLAEMTPRQVIYPVPYALSLVPGAVISTSGSSALYLRNTSASGRALEGLATSATGTNYGVYGTSNSPNGYGGYFYNFGSGIGVLGVSVAGPGVYAGSLGTALRANSGTGAAIAAEGTGRITSTAQSHLWISGNGVRPWHHTDSTYIDMDTIGGAKVYPGATSSARNVMLPIIVPGSLYGQNVTVSALDIYWNADLDNDAITAVLLRRQTGTCDTSSCYVTILNDSVDHTCLTATGCTLHYDLTSNNVLSGGSGALYLTLELMSAADNSYIQVGSVRLTLGHD